jgi:hypothetical protein
MFASFLAAIVCSSVMCLLVIIGGILARTPR